MGSLRGRPPAEGAGMGAGRTSTIVSVDASELSWAIGSGIASLAGCESDVIVRVAVVSAGVSEATSLISCWDGSGVLGFADGGCVTVGVVGSGGKHRTGEVGGCGASSRGGVNLRRNCLFRFVTLPEPSTLIV